MTKKVALHNLGCKVNAYEVDAMEQLLRKAGYEIVPFKEGADIYVINTCTVTNIADRKSRQMLHKAKKMNPEAIVVATGCYVQTDKGTLEKDPAIDIVLGNNQKGNIVQVLEDFGLYANKNIESIDNMLKVTAFENISIENTSSHARAFIKVQDGCNQFCSYCIIPFARGRVRSRELNLVIDEVKNLVKNNYKEVVLTGIHLSSYGIDLKNGENLLDLIKEVAKVDGLERIRLGSLEPRIVTEEFAKEASEITKLCPHFHLSLQSGCNKTLKDMNRRYTSEEFMDAVVLLRKYFDDPALTTDVIVGFPMETDEDFKESYEFIKSVGFYETHIFKYSIREGTVAAKMEPQVNDNVKSKRSDILLNLNKNNMKAYEDRQKGKIKELLIEEEIEENGEKFVVGCTKEYIKKKIKKEEGYEINSIIKITM